MNVPTCYLCGRKMVRNGKTKKGRTRWRCKVCNTSRVNAIDSKAKQLDEFLGWLLSRQRQCDMPGEGRTFRRHADTFWKIWALPPIIDEIHRVVYVDGIYIRNDLVVLIACSDDYVLGWYVTRSEKSRAWEALISRIAPPDMVVTDGGSGFEKARKKIWPDTQVQRCVFHAYNQVKHYTTTRPKLPAGVELYGLAKRLLYIKTEQEAHMWVAQYFLWCKRWDSFLQEKSRTENGWDYTHWRLRKARKSLSILINRDVLFTYLDDLLTVGGPLPATNNRIEGGVNAQLRRVLRDHRGLSAIKRLKAVYWWCYMHTECPMSNAEIIKYMPTDNDIAAIYEKLTYHERTYETIPRWGDAIVWSEFHTSDPWRHDWD